MLLRHIYRINSWTSAVAGAAIVVWGYAGGPPFWSSPILGAALIALSLILSRVQIDGDHHFLGILAPWMSSVYLILLAPFVVYVFAHPVPLAGFVLMAFVYIESQLFNFEFITSIRTLDLLPGFPVAHPLRTPERRTEWRESIREEAAQQERNRLAQDLHDSVKQQIFAIQTNLATAQARWDTDPGAVQEAIRQARNSAREASAEISGMLDQLQPLPLESVGLVEAVRRQAEALALRTGAEVRTHFGDLPTLDLATETVVYRVAQEALANVGRHARARHVDVELARVDPIECLLRIQDDGQGMRPIEFPRGSGLRNMPKRAADIGGSLTVESKPGQGCAVRLRFRPAAYPDGQRKGHVKALKRHGLIFALFAVATTLAIAGGGTTTTA